MRKSYYFLFVAIMFTGCMGMNAKQKNYTVAATYNSYSGGAGSGKGIIFNVQVLSKDQSAFTIESLFINGKKIPFQSRPVPGGVNINSNYFVAFPVKTLQNKDKPQEITDEMITKNKFAPSWIVINKDGKHIKIKNIIYKSTGYQVAP